MWPQPQRGNGTEYPVIKGCEEEGMELTSQKYYGMVERASIRANWRSWEEDEDDDDYVDNLGFLGRDKKDAMELV